jgi:hypothetical protein
MNINGNLVSLSNATWVNEPADAAFDEERAELTITAPGHTDWFISPAAGESADSAPAFIAPVDGDIALSARVHVDFRATFDAGVLVIRHSPTEWAKLCFEYSPQGQPMVVSVVTNGVSDDANSTPIDGDEVYLRVSRSGRAWVFHHSEDGRLWHFVRHFRLSADAPARVGFLAQSPTGEGCTSRFSEIARTSRPPADIRSGE